MDPSNWAQDVLQCDVCENPVTLYYCDLCHVNLCKKCAGEHLLDETKDHKVVPIKQRQSTSDCPECHKHSPKQCELYCEQCDTPICVQCVSSGEHLGHKVVGFTEKLQFKKEILRSDLQEFENFIYPKYQEFALAIPVHKADLNQNSETMTTAIYRHGEVLHREIDSIIEKLKSELDETDTKLLAVLNKQEDEITRTIPEISQIIADLKKLLDSSDDSLVSAYKSRIAEFKGMSLKPTTSLPTFTPQKINPEQLYKQFGSLSALSITKEEHSDTMKTSEAGNSPLKSLLDEPRIISTIQTQYGGLGNGLFRVACNTDEKIWTCGRNKIMSLYNLQGELVKSVQTKSGNNPQDIAVTRYGNLVYTDNNDRTVNIVNNTRIQTVIRLQGWRPLSICSSYSYDLLVVMVSDDTKLTKVVSYYEYSSTEKQIIQYNNKKEYFYKYGRNTKYINENRNLDICVSDSEAFAVMVFNRAGELRFTYTGPPSTTKASFDPVGITTDSQGRILTADHDNHCIHILDQDGQFLRYIDNCHLKYPRGLCVDTRDNLFVAEYIRGKVRKILYLM